MRDVLGATRNGLDEESLSEERLRWIGHFNPASPRIVRVVEVGINK